MKAIGIVRKVDELGRIVLPSELRKTMHVDSGDSFELFTNTDAAGHQTIVLKKYEPGCIFTGNMDNLVEYMGRKVSKSVIMELAQAAGLDVDED